MDKREKTIKPILSAIKLLFSGTPVSTAVIVVISSVFAAIFAISDYTVVLLRDIFNLVITIELSIIGIVFTGYAFFQVLISGDLIIRLMKLIPPNKEGKIETKKKSGNMLMITNRYFLYYLLLCIIVLFIYVCIYFILISMPDTFVLFGDLYANNISAGFLLLLFFFLFFKTIWEMKSFIWNIYQIFVLHSNEEYKKWLEGQKK